jgi:hypothetical protein
MISPDSPTAAAALTIVSGLMAQPLTREKFDQRLASVATQAALLLKHFEHAMDSLKDVPWPPPPDDRYPPLLPEPQPEDK